MSRVLKGKIKRYKIKFIALITILTIIFGILMFLFFKQIIINLINYNKIKTFTKNIIEKTEEEIVFSKSKSNFKLENTSQIINILATSEGSLTSNTIINSQNPYFIKNFKAKADIINKKTLKKDEEINIESLKGALTNNTLSCINNVKGNYIFNIQTQPEEILFFADKITFFAKGEVKGEKLFAIKQTANLEAQNFEIYQSFAKFYNTVHLQNSEYQISSNQLTVYFPDKVISNAIFTKNVIFVQKNNNNTTVYGDNAIYNVKKSTIEIYGNVRSITKTNNIKTRGEKFYYNINTKNGYLVGNKKANNSVEIELEI